LEKIMKLAITGKGGVGKTTVASLIIQHLATQGKRVIAIDADPDANLASALGFSGAETIVPIAEMEGLVEERTGAKPGQSGSFFTINPKVDDLPEKLWLEQGTVRLMVMGTVKKGGGGCVCPESALLKNLVTHVVFYRDDVVVMDMEAGIEHLGRGTATGVDMVIVVVEPGRRSIETAEKIRKLAEDLGITRIGVVGNKVRSEDDMKFIRNNLAGMKILGFIPYDGRLIEADLGGRGVSQDFSKQIEGILGGIEVSRS
jgi:CO dehydrogenase maturation factor